jgi:hypothetical protein
MRFDKYLEFHDYIEPPPPKTAVVKTYPIPIAGFASPDSPGHVFAADPAKEGWQDAQLLERRREPARRGRPRGAAPRLYLGEISPSQAAAWRKSIEVFDEDAGHPRTQALFPEDRANALTPDSSIVQLRLSEMRLCRPRQWGAGWPGNCGALQLDRFWSDRLPANRKGTRWDPVLQVLVSYRLVAPGSEWKLHRDWFGRSAMADLLGSDFRLAEPHKLYACHDFLLTHKADLFSHLMTRWRDLFNVDFDVLLYDLDKHLFRD